jgi:hypothetical protein
MRAAQVPLGVDFSSSEQARNAIGKITTRKAPPLDNGHPRTALTSMGGRKTYETPDLGRLLLDGGVLLVV